MLGGVGNISGFAEASAATASAGIFCEFIVTSRSEVLLGMRDDDIISSSCSSKLILFLFSIFQNLK